MKRVLIVNKCGLLSALPTEKEFCFLDFTTEGKFFGLVEVYEEDAAKIRQEANRVKVLMPGLPKPEKAGQWLYVAVVNGRLRLINSTPRVGFFGRLCAKFKKLHCYVKKV